MAKARKAEQEVKREVDQRLREIARDMGWSLSEHGFTRLGEAVQVFQARDEVREFRV